MFHCRIRQAKASFCDMQSTAVDRDWKVQAGDDLAKNLGESCLLADLGPLLRMKQVQRFSARVLTDLKQLLTIL